MMYCGLNSSGGVTKVMTMVEPLAELKAEEKEDVYKEKQLPTCNR